MWEWTKKYWKIGHSFYREYPHTWTGQVRALLMFWALPPCDKIIVTAPNNKIYVGSFDGADRVISICRQLGVEIE